MTRIALAYLQREEWTMGNGQCHECCGLKPAVFLGHPNAPTEDYLGHDKDCQHAAALADLGDTPLYRTKRF